MNVFIKKRLDNIIKQIEPLYAKLDEKYEEIHNIEEKLNKLEDEFNRYSEGIADPYYKGFRTMLKDHQEENK